MKTKTRIKITSRKNLYQDPLNSISIVFIDEETRRILSQVILGNIISYANLTIENVSWKYQNLKNKGEIPKKYTFYIEFPISKTFLQHIDIYIETLNPHEIVPIKRQGSKFIDVVFHTEYLFNTFKNSR